MTRSKKALENHRALMRRRWERDPTTFKSKKSKAILDGRDYLETYNYLLQLQGGRCAICKRPATKYKKRLSLDHNHRTGLIRGLLCNSCNRNLGFVELYSKSIVKYLKQRPPLT